MHQEVSLKLKQASAVLGVDPKDLQNLVQFKVLRSPRRDSIFWFDSQLLLEAKVALYLKESLGTSTELLARFTEALSKNLQGEKLTGLKYVRYLFETQQRLNSIVDFYSNLFPLRGLES